MKFSRETTSDRQKHATSEYIFYYFWTIRFPVDQVIKKKKQNTKKKNQNERDKKI
jgi:hypothetical protein